LPSTAASAQRNAKSVKNGRSERETWERRAVAERLNVASPTLRRTPGRPAGKRRIRFRFPSTAPFFAGRRRAVSDVFPSSAAFPEAELNQQRSETRR